MKFRHIVTGTILTAMLMAASALTAFAAVPKGRFEAVTDTSVSGWAYDSDSPDEPLNVRIVITNKETGEAVLDERLQAGDYRENLYETGKGNGCHGFTLPVDWASFPDGTYTIEGYTADRDFSNPKTYTKGGEAHAEAAPASDSAQDPEAAAAAGQQPEPAASPDSQPAAAESTDAQSTSLIPLGTFKTTGYCPCKSCSAGWGRHTSTGAVATAGHTIAVDPRVIPYGTQVMINNVVYTAEDKGGGVKGKHIDIFYDTHAEARQHAVGNVEVYLVQPA